MPNQIETLSDRVRALEEWRASQMVVQALSKNDMKHMDERFDRIEKQIEKSRGFWVYLLLIAATVVIGAFVNWMLGGGMLNVS